LGPDGKIDPDHKVDNTDGSYSTFFTETGSGKYVPRSLFIDLDPSPIDEIRTGRYRSLFHPDLMVSGKEDASNKYDAHDFYSRDPDRDIAMPEVTTLSARN
jgi:tubulin alpha